MNVLRCQAGPKVHVSGFVAKKRRNAERNVLYPVRQRQHVLRIQLQQIQAVKSVIERIVMVLLQYGIPVRGYAP